MELTKLHVTYTLTTVFMTAVAIFAYKKWRNRRVKIGRVSRIILYPIKSLAGLEVQKAICKNTGLEKDGVRDRMWMLVKPSGNFLNLLDEPRMVSIFPKMEDGQLVLEAEGTHELRIDIIKTITPDTKIIQCKMYNKIIEGVDCGEKSAKWFQKFLHRNDIRLVQYLPNFKTRPSDFENLSDLNEENYPLIYQASNPYLILSEASLEDFNDRSEQYVSYRNFRPNIVIEDSYPFEEDKWKYLKIGNETLLIKTIPCERCSATKINPEDGTFMKSEPLATLKTFRIAKDSKQKKVFGEKPLFGMNYGLISEGEIHLGDEIYGFN